MNIAVCYIAVSKGPITENYCARFVASYFNALPEADHSTIVICNGGPLCTSIAMMFSPMNPIFLPRQNDEGFDLSGYVAAANGPAKDYDAMLCLGESVYFHRAGWLKRLAEAWDKHGPGMYGPFGSHNVRAHLNTTAFMCPPALLSEYPVKEWTRALRYEFEHGMTSFWRRLHSSGIPVRMVTWDGEWPPGTWRRPNNILWRGDQSNLLMFCNHSERWAYAARSTKTRWSSNADQFPK